MEEIKKFDALCLIWQKPVTGQKYRIGILCKHEDEKYSFVFLSEGLRKARNAGFCTELGFDFNNPYKIYNSSKLFSVFKIRRPGKDSFNQLKLDGGTVVTDNISFEKITDEDIKQFKHDKEKREKYNI